MEAQMIQKIDAVLDRVNDPESMLSMAQLGFVKGVRYDEEHKRLYVFTSPLNQTRKCCTVMVSPLVSGAVKPPPRN
jgi:metal-sulfur cluster biosynthetic enzyme